MSDCDEATEVNMKKYSDQSEIYVSMHYNDENELNKSFDKSDKSSSGSSTMLRSENVNSKASIINKRQSAQVDIFVDNFIKPEKRKDSIESTTSNSTNLSKKLISRVARKQLDFNLLVIGDSGVGKKTFIKSLLSKHLDKNTDCEEVYEKSEAISFNNHLIEKTFDLVNDRHKVSLKVIEVPEYGCGMQSNSTFSDLNDYVNTTFEECFKMECAINRKFVVDKKIHCCLYFVSPYGHGLRPIDIEFLKSFRSKFNIVLVIAKSDIFTKTELMKFKENIWNDLKKNEIDLFEYLNEYGNEEDEDYENLNTVCQEIQNNMPFPLVCSSNYNSDTIKSKGNKVALRNYPWGIVEVDNKDVSCFQALDNILFQSHLNYFRKMTKNVFYENFRVQYILDRVEQQVN